MTAEKIRTDYLAAWNAADEDRAGAVTAAFTEDARYVDPLADVTGADAIAALIGQVRQQFPGMVFSPFGAADGHHDVLRFGWGLGPAGGEPVVVGFDVARLDGDGRIATVHGFLDRVPG